MADPQLRFLTPEWAEALAAAANASESFRDAARGVRVTIQQAIDDTDGYTLTIDDGTLSVRWGTADDADVTFVQTRETAERISQGALNAQQAFVLGKLRVRGDLARLLPARQAFGELEGAFAGLRDRTRY